MKIKVSNQFRDMIRILRKTYGIRAYELSKSINKSSSYISQFERGSISSIDFELSIKIFQNITRLKDQELIDYIKKLIFNSLDIHTDEYALNFFLNFHMVYVNYELINSIVDAILDASIFSIYDTPHKINYSFVKLNNLSHMEYYIDKLVVTEVFNCIENDQCKVSYACILELVKVKNGNLYDEADEYLEASKFLETLGITIIPDVSEFCDKSSVQHNNYYDMSEILESYDYNFEENKRSLLIEFEKMLDIFNDKDSKTTSIQINNLKKNIINLPSMVFTIIGFPFNESKILTEYDQRQILSQFLKILNT